MGGVTSSGGASEAPAETSAVAGAHSTTQPADTAPDPANEHLAGVNRNTQIDDSPPLLSQDVVRKVAKFMRKLYLLLCETNFVFANLLFALQWRLECFTLLRAQTRQPWLV